MVNSKGQTISGWRQNGLILSSKEEGFEIYDRRENSTNCEKCGKEYKSTRDKHMDHSHDIHNKYGYFRNILCQSCNLRRDRLQYNNTSGYNGISKVHCTKYKHGFAWVFRVYIAGKLTHIKSSVDKESLIKFAIQWKIDNNYDDYII